MAQGWAVGQAGWSAGVSYVVEGVEAGLPVATLSGWCPSGALRAGARVVTVGGHAPLRGVFRARLSAGGERGLWPLALPAGALGNPVGIVLPPDQRVAVGTDGGAVLMPARALEHWRGVARMVPDGRAVVRLCFDCPQVVVGAGVLFSCGDGAGIVAPGLPEAREIVARHIAFDAGRALGQAARVKRR